MDTSHEQALSQVFYVSRCLLTDIRQVRQLHQACQANNAKRGLTGLLLFTGEHFAQLLEGPPETLSDLVERIARDPRHTSMRTLSHKPLARRACPQWSMRLLEAREVDASVRYVVEAAQPPLAEATDLLALVRSLAARDSSATA